MIDRLLLWVQDNFELAAAVTLAVIVLNIVAVWVAFGRRARPETGPETGPETRPEMRPETRPETGRAPEAAPQKRSRAGPMRAPQAPSAGAPVEPPVPMPYPPHDAAPAPRPDQAPARAEPSVARGEATVRPTTAGAPSPSRSQPEIARDAILRPSSGAPIGDDKQDHFVVTVHYGTDRADIGPQSEPADRFTDDRARPAAGHSHISYGTCAVSIPKIHKVGELEAPTWLRSEQPAKHVMVLGVGTKEADAFFRDLNAAMGDRKQAFVFVHGFSVSFEDAARRTAQMAFDLKFAGAPIFFSWPTEVLGITNPDPTAYSEAENNARWATQHFRAFLLDVIQKTGAETVHLIAHSMGNRVVTDALMELFWILRESEKRVLGEVILTAPDIDADVFIEQIAPRITAMNSRVTLYASTRDKALNQSRTVHGYPRVGDFGAIETGRVRLAQVEIVDASEVDTDSFGHSYYGNSESVLSDICHLMTTRTSAVERQLTLATHAFQGGGSFWRVKREVDLATVWASIASRLPHIG